MWNDWYTFDSFNDSRHKLSVSFSASQCDIVSFIRTKLRTEGPNFYSEWIALEYERGGETIEWADEKWWLTHCHPSRNAVSLWEYNHGIETLKIKTVVLDLKKKILCHVCLQGGWGGWPTGNGKKLSNSQACCLAQLCLACCLVSFHFLWAIHPIRPVLSLGLFWYAYEKQGECILFAIMYY